MIATHTQKAKQAALTTFDVDTGMTVCAPNGGFNEHALLKGVNVYTPKKGFTVSLGAEGLLVYPDTELIIGGQLWVWNGAVWRRGSDE